MTTKSVSKTIFFWFLGVFALIPLILYPQTSELFEFNKMIATYCFTTIIVALWVIKMILAKKPVFHSSSLDIPLIIFLATQLLSSIFSIDTRTSFLGYYSRFNGGFLSSLTYALLYWAYVSNLTPKKAVMSLKVLLASAAVVSTYALLQHFGIDKNIWVQDVQNRVFSTLGQPNWLAAWIVALTPITWAMALQSKIRFKKLTFWIAPFLSGLLILTLLYTKSRSGLLGFGVASILFWALAFTSHLKPRQKVFNFLTVFFIFNFLYLIFTLLVGSPWTPSLTKLVSKNETPRVEEKATGPALEVGGSSSAEIRKIVWRGAWDIFRAYPILGTGVETFAFSYYKFRPIEHNFVSEWDYLYNKAHNQYLNMAANTGVVGLTGYFILIAGIIWVFIKNKSKTPKSKFSILGHDYKYNILDIALLSGFISLLVTNFFGFSVVPVDIEFFLFPAVAITLANPDTSRVTKKEKLTASQKLAIGVLLFVTCYLLFDNYRYWQADLAYAKGEQLNDASSYLEAKNYLTKAVAISQGEALYWQELATANSQIAQALAEDDQSELAQKFAGDAVSQTQKALTLAPASVNLKRSSANVYVNLAAVDPNYLLETIKILEQAIAQAPTEPKLYFNLGLAYARVGNLDKAIQVLEKTVELKPDYRNARLGLGLIYYDAGKTDDAKFQLNYILEHINPNDQQVITELGNF